MKRYLAFWTILLMAPIVNAQDDFDPFDPLDDDARTGIAIGERIPDFSAVDQHGNVLDFDAVKGENGAMLLFHRSADW